MRIPSPLSRRKARIEIIPLIDIMFFLLATFMMVSLAMIQNLSVPVNFPSAHSAEADSAQASAVIAVTKEGKIFWNKEETALDGLSPRLEALKSSDAGAKVFIHGDKAAPFGLVVSVLDSVRKSGIKKTAIRTLSAGK